MKKDACAQKETQMTFVNVRDKLAIQTYLLSLKKRLTVCVCFPFLYIETIALLVLKIAEAICKPVYYLKIAETEYSTTFYSSVKCSWQYAYAKNACH